MPLVFATGFLVGLLEWTCIKAIAPHLDHPDEQSVGTHIDISHVAATPPGLIVKVDAELVGIDGRRLVFSLQAHDGIDLISQGRHERFVIDRPRFDLKTQAKLDRAGPLRDCSNSVS